MASSPNVPGNPEEKAENAALSPNNAAPEATTKPSAAEIAQRDLTSAIEAGRVSGEVPTATGKALTQLATILNEDSDHPIDANPEALNQAADQLRAMGAHEADIHAGSLVLASDADRKLATLNGLARSSNAPTRNYKSNVGFYGVQARLDESSGKPELIYSKGGLEKFLCWAERLILKADDLGEGLLTSIFRKGVRGKGTLEEAVINAEALGLSGFRTENGLAVEAAEDMVNGAILDDVLRQSEGQEFLEKIDKTEAIKAAARHLNEIHQRNTRGIGEVLANDLVLSIKDGKINSARLTLPDTIYSPEIQELEQKATDMLDFCFSIASAGFQKGGAELARDYLSSALQEYQLDSVRSAMKALLPTRPAATGHSLIRLGFDRVPEKKHAFETVRQLLAAML